MNNKGFRKMTKEERQLDYKSSSYGFYISQLVSAILLIIHILVKNTLNDIILTYIIVGWVTKLIVEYKYQRKIFKLIGAIFLFVFFIIYFISAFNTLLCK